MLLLTWHGTLVCLRQDGGGLIHAPIDAVPADAAPVDVDIGTVRPETGTRVQSILGPLVVGPGLGPRDVCVARYGQLLCAEPDPAAITFNRMTVGLWESFLPLTAAELADLRQMLGNNWIDAASRQVHRRGTGALRTGFRLEIAGSDLDLAQGMPLRTGAAEGPARGFELPSGGETVRIVLAEPRSSALLQTQSWPVRARRHAEMMVLAAHRQVVGWEPEQGLFEDDVGLLLSHRGPAALDMLLERLVSASASASASAAAEAAAAAKAEAALEQAVMGLEDPGEAEDDVLLSWAMRQTASWQPGSIDPERANAEFEALNDSTSWAFVFRINDGAVQMDDKPDTIPADTMDAARAEYYLTFLQGVARRLPPEFAATLCMITQDQVIGTHDVPVFGFQSRAEDRDLLLPDIDLLIGNFYDNGDYDDPTAYEEKSATAIFAGSTTGGQISRQIARDLSLPRLRAAAFFDGHERVDFRLPSIVQFDKGADAILRQHAFCQKPLMDWTEQLNHRMLISMDGNGATCQRVALALRSNSVLLKYDSPHMLYYFGGLQPWLHYVPVSRDADMDTILAREAAAPERFKRIAANGRRFAEKYLTRDAAERYTMALLQAYAGIFPLSSAGERNVPAVRPNPGRTANLIAHIQEHGDQTTRRDGWTGRAGSGLAIEGLAIFFGADIPQDAVSYQVVLDGGALSEVAHDGAYLGTRGEGAPIYGLRIMADEGAQDRFDIAYTATFVDGAGQGPCAPGELCAVPSGAALEAVFITVQKREAPAPAALHRIVEAIAAFGRSRPQDGNAAGSEALTALANACMAPFREVGGIGAEFSFGVIGQTGRNPKMPVAVTEIELVDGGAMLRLHAEVQDPWTMMTRLLSLVFLMDTMMSGAPVPPRRFLAEFGDAGLRMDSVSICSVWPETLLVPDPDFISSGGYDEDRLLARESPAWEERRPVVFWRGATTGRRRHAPPADAAADDFTWLPRLDMCHRARISPSANLYDVGIAKFAQLTDPALIARIEAADLYRPHQPRAAFMACKAVLVIDGNSNAWSALFCALLGGACVLKVKSEQGFRQWYYDRLQPWVHFVPVRADLEDLDDAVAWVMAHDEEARAIAEAGRAFADAMTFDGEVADSVARLRGWLSQGGESASF